MPGRGPAPKPTRSRPNDQARRDAETTTRTDDGEVRGFDLPSRMPGIVFGEGEDRYVESEWPARTVAWWETWRRSPLTQGWGSTDWDFLLDTALLHARLWLGEAKVAAELRLRVAKFGATPEDRMRLREQIATPAPPTTPAPPVRQDSRRARLLKVVGDGA